ncbi:HAMP domain-containing protein [Mycolicibacillus parakoreensis]|uniref:Adenylate/guanylate cyclase domain-containing protein n=1 Tax=Mycolicibacillus parakoreensis TaxID=1069221 RepID=A0ABY3U5Z8_9MYCO|nr:adenylate/guanylate cyclase domain-containing protein [Mycolicibacillus parakoreensis]MCV7317596.1 HAMP domain-containing protein [Mycolicibacillus parakoreensis]ULN54299.1 adenylate/guanylate cyclase domain-containing protein [Mycolicibacillus parakoreensis]
MSTNSRLARRLGAVLETLTGQGARPTSTPAYGSWLLGRVSEPQPRRRVRLQAILTIFIVAANLLGIGVAMLLVAVAFPVPNVFLDAPAWLTFGVVPAYIAFALVTGTFWITRRTVRRLRWSIEQKPPNRTDQRNIAAAPWRVARGALGLWAMGAALLTVLYGLVDTLFIPQVLFTIVFSGVVVSTACYLLTEFALRPVAAAALAAGPPQRRFATRIMGRTMTVWLLGSGVPVVGIALTAWFVLLLHNMNKTQFAWAVIILSGMALVFGFVLMWILSWLTATPVRAVRTAMRRVEQGDLDTTLVVFDGTELGELQRGFNAMVDGLRERERLRDLFGRHVGREVAAAAAEAALPELGGEERHVAVIFVDIIGSTELITGRPASEVVALLNRFFSVIVDEVDRHHGLVNKFEGDATLAIFGAPVALEAPEGHALAAARAISHRLRAEVPACQAGIGVAAGEAVAGNIGARERFEYTVIGEPVNEAARLCELAKTIPCRVLSTSDTVAGAGEDERVHWSRGETVTLRGYDEPVHLVMPC